MKKRIITLVVAMQLIIVPFAHITLAEKSGNAGLEPEKNNDIKHPNRTIAGNWPRWRIVSTCLCGGWAHRKTNRGGSRPGRAEVREMSPKQQLANGKDF